MRVFVAGGTGVIGRRLVPQLVAREWLPHLAPCAGAKPPRRAPMWRARILAGEVAVTMMTEGRGFSNSKAKRELGWELRHPSWRQGFMARWSSSLTFRYAPSPRHNGPAV